MTAVTDLIAAPLGAATPGPLLFARYAAPPNRHGYCGPDDADGFFASGVAGDDAHLRESARDFDGALPFLRLIADAGTATDPLDPAVVEAYWLGGPLLEEVAPSAAADGFGTASGPLFATLEQALRAGARPHHSFVVFCVYPWVAMLGDVRRAPQAMRVLDGCRIRWGRVLAVTGDRLSVESQPLTWDGRRLDYGPPAVESVRRAIDGRGLTSPLAVGDPVALHWDWVCDRISAEQQAELVRYSARHLDLANSILANSILANSILANSIPADSVLAAREVGRG